MTSISVRFFSATARESIAPNDGPVRQLPSREVERAELAPGVSPLELSRRSAKTASDEVRNIVNPLPRDKNFTRTSVCPWLASKLSGSLP